MRFQRLVVFILLAAAITGCGGHATSSAPSSTPTLAPTHRPATHKPQPKRAPHRSTRTPHHLSARELNASTLAELRQGWKVIRDGVGLARAKVGVLEHDLSNDDVSMRPHYAGFDLEWAMRWTNCARSAAGGLPAEAKPAPLQHGLDTLSGLLNTLYDRTNNLDTTYSDYADTVEAAKGLDPIWDSAGERVRSYYASLGGDPGAIASITSRVDELRNGDVNNVDECQAS